MDGLPLPNIYALPLATVVALVLTALMIAVAQKRQWVAKPRADRWHQKPTAFYGGVPIFASFALGASLMVPALLAAKRGDIAGLLVGAVIAFAVGLRDDIQSLNPVVKLLGQVLATMPFLVGTGLAFASPAFTVSIPFVLFWLVALTNAFNLLDNMDGLCAGTAAIVGGVLSLYAFLNGIAFVGTLSALITASCLGFLFFNFRAKGSAQIFMGDCGSLPLGFLLACLALLGIGPHTPDYTFLLVTPLLIMALPIFDTTLVIIMRKREGRAISQGGRDHTSHRLVYTGLSEKQAVLLLYGVSLLSGGLAIALELTKQSLLGVAGLAVISLLMTAFGVYLSHYAAPRQAVVSTPARNPKLDTAP